ncbi:unnamed protein product [Allacma fusca]|uniref:Phospholipase n=1 Tax=Allacma fusca TaxID=39272 RepID=A0A8J2KPI9_9HEXA|nr:unnamed protein product [Allacma fusca]
MIWSGISSPLTAGSVDGECRRLVLLMQLILILSMTSWTFQMKMGGTMDRLQKQIGGGNWRKIQHGEHTWKIKRRYKHFQHLHQQLQLYRATLSIPFPTKSHRERRSSYKSTIRDESGKSQGLPRFPKRPEALIASDQLEERRKVLEVYLQNLVKIRAFRNHHETLEFLEVSQLSFVHGLGPKGKEGLVLKRTGNTHAGRCSIGLCNCLPCFRMQRCCGDCCGQWQRRWLVVKDTFVAYIRPKDGVIHCVMLFDAEFEVSSGLFDIGEPHGVVISNLSRQLVVKCWTKRRSKEWLDFLRGSMQREIAKSFLGPNRFMSFAPLRPETQGRWFVDGASHMSAIADVLEAAHEEIFIADWWLSPEIYMKRPVVEGERWRLDKILERKAKEGVKIFILLYKEVNLALGINSFYSKQKLVQQSHENIKVLRHPDHVKSGVLMWAHHEKLVVVDQMYAFVGGIDLCYGRWDDPNHRLCDLGSVSKSALNLGLVHMTKITSSKPGGGIATPSILQLAKATNAVTIGTVGQTGPYQQAVIVKSASTADLDEIDEEIKDEVFVESKVHFAEMASSEGVENGIGDGLAVGGYGEDVVDDSAAGSQNPDANGDVPLKGETPPTGRKNFMRKMTKVSRGLKEDSKEWFDRHVRRRSSNEDDSDGSNEEGKKNLESEGGGPDGERTFKKSRVRRSTKGHPIVLKSKSDSALIGLQGSSKLWIGKDYTNFIVKDFTDLESPFTDLVDRNTTPRMPWHDIATMVEGRAARDVARHFIQRWNAVKDEKARVHPTYPYLLPKTYDFKNESVPPILTESWKSSKVTAQVVRSVSQWSAGIRMVDDSLMQAYVDSIENSKHYIYIENQFFITLASANVNVQNRIGEALLQRILRAHREKTTFRVFVIIPLLPGFEGEVGTNRGIAIHAITHWNYSSICRGPDAIMVRLKNEGITDPGKYVSFHGLRTHSELHGDLITELIYVHSKLMIVDDNLVICGSANINDRSMLGKRDSEVAVIYQDEEYIQSFMDGKEYKAGKFAHSLRVNLFREHLGLLQNLEVDLRDPISDDFYVDVWLNTSITNTEIYDTVFQCVPTDNCQTFARLREYQQDTPLCHLNPDAARKALEKVQGFLVMLPLQFLCQENLLPATGTREALMPTALWT